MNDSYFICLGFRRRSYHALILDFHCIAILSLAMSTSTCLLTLLINCCLLNIIISIARYVAMSCSSSLTFGTSFFIVVALIGKCLICLSPTSTLRVGNPSVILFPSTIFMT